MKRAICMILSGLALSTSVTLAGGVLLYEVGTPEVGLASAGWAARAEDSATVLTNPAGMTRIETGDLMLGLQALYGDVGFTPDSRTTTTGSDGGNAVGLFPGGGFYWVHPTTERLRLGLAVAGNFGLGLDYDDDWAGRYYVQDGTLLGISVVPAVAWKINDKVSVGAALNATYGIFDTKIAVNNVAPSASDGTLELDDTVWGYGGNIGFLFEASDDTRFGFTYTSPVDLDFAGTPKFTNLATGLATALDAAGLLDSELDLSMTVPQTGMASFVHALGERWSLLGNVGWQDWSEFGKVDVLVNSANPASLTVDLNFEDTWHLALGSRVNNDSPWSYSFGAAYDSSPLEDADRTPTLPVGESWRFGFGAGRGLGQSFDLALSYELAWGGTLALDQQRGPLSGRLAGEYEDTAIHFFATSLRWKRN